MPGTLFAPGPGSYPRGDQGPQIPAMLTHIAIETLVEDYVPLSAVSVPSKIRIKPGVRMVWEMHRGFGQYLAVMAHFPAVGRREVPEALLKEYMNNFNRRMNGTIDGFFYCPHERSDPDPRISVCNCMPPTQYGLPCQAHFFFENSFNIPFFVGFQTIVGTEEYRVMADAGGYNFVSEEEIQADAVKAVAEDLKLPTHNRILSMGHNLTQR